MACVRVENMSAFSGLGGLGLLGGDLVTRYGADVSILSLSLFADASAKILGLADKLASLGFLASISKINRGYIYTSFHVTLSKVGLKPFSENDAKAALAAAIAQQGLSLSQITGIAGEALRFAAEAPGTAFSEKGQQQTSDFFRAAGSGAAGFFGNPVCAAIEGATGVGCKKVVFGGAVLLGLFYAWPVIAPLLGAGSERVARRIRGGF
jgi:hypothetical protein